MEERNREIKRNALLITLVSMIIVVAIWMYFLIIPMIREMMLFGIKKDYLLIICITSAVICIIARINYKRAVKRYTLNEEAKYKVHIISELLMSHEKLEVIPIKARDYNQFITKELPKIAKFYIAGTVEKNFVVVFVKFNNELEMKYLEKIRKDVLTDYYQIVENE